MDMETAPRDGTRILINTHVYAFDNQSYKYKKVGTQWIECWWANDLDNNYKWSEWCGTKHSRSTMKIDPIEWFPVPENSTKPIG